MKSRLGAAVAMAALLGAACPVVLTVPAQAAATATSVPRPDHVVIVVEENHSGSGIVGNPNAPYISSLAANNANFTASYALTHPSQPNYIGLFSGSTQGVTDDSCPHSFATPSLGDALIGAGLGFTGYSESQPSAGYTGCYGGALYARKHSPWVDFPAIPASSSQPFTAFPSDYSTLPAVSFVIPNLQNDMHDGTIAQGDAWLQNNMAGYVSWAKTHNSLFILTFDEDDNSANNRIPTIFAGARVAGGSYSETINHYNVLRTIEDAYGLTPLGNSATSSPILDVWTTAPAGDPKPIAAFSSSCQGLTCTFDGSDSSDDTSVASWSWDFGDGTVGTGSSVQHTYSGTGTFPVTLIVSDDQGAQGDPVSHSVSVTAPAGSAFVSDSFARTLSNGWGSAPVGGAWSGSGSAAFSVSPGAGAISLKAGAQLGAYVGGVTRTDTDVLTALSLNAVPVGGPVYLMVQGRRVSSGNEYNAKVLVNADRSVTIRVSRLVGSAETVLAGPVKVSGLTYAAGMALDIRLQVTGTSPTTVRARAWAASGAEPGTWQVSGSDSTAALQAPGAVGLTAYMSAAVTPSPITVTASSVTAKPTAAQANQVPTAAFTSSCTQLSCSFSGSGSTDQDGSVTGWSWDFGDGATGAGAGVQHAFALAGTYPVKLTVTDNQGAASAPITHSVTVTAPPPNQPPTAAFTSSCQALVCSFNGTASSDDEGVTSWTWDFGDGATTTGSTVYHTFADADSYDVQLTVADDDDATDSVMHSVTVSGSPPVNERPTAAFTSSCSQLSCSFNGGGSSDDGSVTGWAWNFGDGTTGTGSSVSHSYGGTGTYSVTLTVTDNQGATSDPVSHSVSVTAPTGTPFVSDSFARTVSNGWGTAPTGGAWATYGSATWFSVAPGAAAIRLNSAGAQLGGYLPSATRTDTDVLTAVALDKVPVAGPVYLMVQGRRVSTNNEYDAKLVVAADKSVTVRVTRLVGGAETALSAVVKVPNVVYAAGMVLNVRLQVTGTAPTTVRARVWASGSEPATWQVSGTDSTAALQAAGAVGLVGYLSSTATNAPVTVRLSSITAKPTTAP